jgi:tRNA1(Val) A37 N6-methylase TrmN6
MTDEETQAQIVQLQQQQALLTQALAAALAGRWTGGADTVEGYLFAIDPNLEGLIVANPPYYDE